MKPIKLRTKIEAVGLGLLLIALSVIGVFGVTRTITSSSDTYDTYIRNSNGNYWAATGANIQIAIWDLNSSGGYVQLPIGTFSIIKDIKMEKNVWLKGCGNATLIYQASGTYTQGAIKCNSLKNFTISDLAIYGNKNTLGTNGYNGIDINGCNGFIINNIRTYNTSRSGIMIYGYSKDGIVTNCIMSGITGAFQALSVNDADDCSISNIINRNGSGISGSYAFDFVDVIGFEVNNILSTNSGGGGIKVSSTSDFSYNSTFNNLVFEDCLGTGYVNIEKAKKCSFSNIFAKGSISAGSNGIVIGSTCNYININNAFLENTLNVGLTINGNNVTANNIQILNTTSYGFQLYGDDVSINNLHVHKAASFNLIQNAYRFTISNSEFSYGSNMGLSIQTCANFIISNCIFVGNTGDAIDTTSATCNNYTISNCYFKSNGKAMDINAADNWFLIGYCIADSGDSIDINAVRTSTRRVNDTICTLVES